MSFASLIINWFFIAINALILGLLIMPIINPKIWLFMPCFLKANFDAKTFSIGYAFAY